MLTHNTIGNKELVHTLEVKNEHDEFVIQIVKTKIRKTDDNEIFALSLRSKEKRPGEGYITVYIKSDEIKAIAEILGKIADGEFKNGNTTGVVPPGA